MAFAFEKLNVYQKAVDFADRKHFFIIARGSVQECVPLLELAVRRKFIKPDAHQTLCNDLEEIAKMISGLINGHG